MDEESFRAMLAVQKTAGDAIVKALRDLDGVADPARIVSAFLFISIESLVKVAGEETAVNITLKALELSLPKGALTRIELPADSGSVH